MNNYKHKKLKEQADKLAKLTFLLARACEDKENHFIRVFDLTNAEFRLMRFLHDNQRLHLKDLASEMGLTPGRISHLIASLEKKNYVKREVDENDRRNVKIRLTSNAMPYIENVTEKHTELHEKVLEQIPPKHRDSVLNAIQELLDSMSVWSKSKNESKEAIDE